MKKFYLSILVLLVALSNYAASNCANLSTNDDNGIEKIRISVGDAQFKMIRVDGGTFQMGATSEQSSYTLNERPVHEVTLSTFYICETEVTQQLWQAVMGETMDDVYQKYPDSDPGAVGPQQPMYNISYSDCLAFIKKLNQLTGQKFRLPTEAEWEFAARGGLKTNKNVYSGARMNNCNSVGWTDDNSQGHSHDVKQLKPNELGLYDMSGNVFEWVKDWYRPYTSDAQVDPQGPTSGWDGMRCIRGGGWNDYDDYARVSARSNMYPDVAVNYLGMRLAATTITDPDPLQPSTADVNTDGLVNTTDVVSIYNTIINGYDRGEPITTLNVKGVEFKLIPVEGGTFTMGADNNDPEANSDEQPAHQVTLSDFYICETEITQQLWQIVMGNNPSYTSNEGEQFPVGQITWLSAQKFINALNFLTNMNFRLPTEAEWEYAARGGNKSQSYIYSGSNNYSDVASTGETVYDVKKYAPNELGIYGMTGNAAELTEDKYNDYTPDPQVNPLQTEAMLGYSNSMVIRGGSYRKEESCGRVTARDCSERKSGLADFGLRLVVSEPYATSTPADVNGDLTVNSADVVTVYNTIINGEPQAVKKIYVDGIAINMHYVQGGEFTMGSTSEHSSYNLDTRPTHQVILSDYYIAETEVTQELWETVMGKSVADFAKERNLNFKYGQGFNYPMYYITYDDCQTFIQKLNQLTGQKFRLPTEAEWEYAARGGNKAHSLSYPGDQTAGDISWFTNNSDNTTHPVKTKNPNELGLYDMAGNVMEAVQDWYGPYSEGLQTNPTGPTTGEKRVYRGGSFDSTAAWGTTCARYPKSPTDTNKNGGLRLAMDK